ncbi:hypothetical protein TIFTF001_022044 [Ficus carica]|uniref:Uncharacterized protein n=1 Tax=Ficus carica TaxID=3494 RepID=A0AA88AT79_FICCA|nr:hypothetical protein TIFTF001_022044 [Ficus carica]
MGSRRLAAEGAQRFPVDGARRPRGGRGPIGEREEEKKPDPAVGGADWRRHNSLTHRRRHIRRDPIFLGGLGKKFQFSS